MKESGVLRRVEWLVFGVMPTIVLAACIVLTMIVTIVLDHEILGRDADGWPVLYKTPLLRNAVTIFHFEIMYALPVVLAVLFLAWGRRAGASRSWILTGGVLVCALGGFPIIEAAWTGVKGTSELNIGVAEDARVVAARMAVNLAIFATAFGIFQRR